MFGNFPLLHPAPLTLALLAPSANAEIAVVLDSNDDDISLIDTATYREIKRVPIGKEPHHLIATPDNRYPIIGLAGEDSVEVLAAHDGKTPQKLKTGAARTTSCRWTTAGTCFSRTAWPTTSRSSTWQRSRSSRAFQCRTVRTAWNSQGRRRTLGHDPLDQPRERDRHEDQEGQALDPRRALVARALFS